MGKKHLKERIAYLEESVARTSKAHEARQHEFYQKLRACLGEGHLVLPTGAVLPVVISDFNITHQPFGPSDVVVTVYPQPPK